MFFFRAGLKNIRACPFSKATEKCFLGALDCYFYFESETFYLLINLGVLLIL